MIPVTESEYVLVSAAYHGQDGAYGLDPADLAHPALRLVYVEACRLAALGEAIDAVRLAHVLPPVVAQQPRTAWLTRAVLDAPAAADLGPHIDRIRSHAARRRIADAAARTAAEASTLDLDDVPAWARAAGDRIADLGAAASTQTRAIPLVTGEALAAVVPDVPWLVPALQLAPGRPIILGAYGGAGKTWVACDIALAIASGSRRALDAVDVARSGHVVHLNWEMPTDALRLRYQRLARGRGVDISTADLGIANRAELAGFELASSDARRRLVDTVSGAALLVVDSLRAALPGVDENGSEVRRYLDLLLEVSEVTGVCALVIHHEGKPPSTGETRSAQHRLRGSSGINDAADTTWHVEPAEVGWRLRQGKVSRGRAADPIGVELVDTPDGGVRFTWVPEAQARAARSGGHTGRVEAEARDAILLALGTHAVLSTAAITDGTRHGIAGAPSTRKRALRALAADGFVSSSPGERGATMWRLV